VIAVVDRVEGEVVVFDVEGRAVTLARSLVPGEPREGDTYRLTLEPDALETERRRASVAERLARLTK
jgi:hypothetical protein